MREKIIVSDPWAVSYHFSAFIRLFKTITTPEIIWDVDICKCVKKKLYLYEEDDLYIDNYELMKH